MNCMTCNSANTVIYATKISDFLVERIYGQNEENPMPINLVRCRDCGFSYYDRRLTDLEEQKLYLGYRADEYQKMRQKHDIWYTSKINYALGNDASGLAKRKRIIENVCKKTIITKIENALDYGGDMGQKYPEGMEIDHKYVYDISGVDTIKGVVQLKSLDAVRQHQYDFIMCNQVLEHVNNINAFIEILKSFGSNNTWYYFDVPYDSPFEKSGINNLQYIFNPYFSMPVMIKHLFKIKKQGFFAPMSEHVNYFTPKSLTSLFERHGFETKVCCVNVVSDVLGRSKIISLLCKSI
jgi:hypothetical protein